jgi:hypothetical protein
MDEVTGADPDANRKQLMPLVLIDRPSGIYQNFGKYVREHLADQPLARIFGFIKPRMTLIASRSLILPEFPFRGLL